MTKTVVFIGVAIQFADFQVPIGRKLEEKGIKVKYVTYSKEAYLHLKKQKQDAYYIPGYTVKANVETTLKKLEEKYDFNTNLLLFADVDHSHMPRKKALKNMIDNFAFWETFLKNNDIDMILGPAERYAGLVPYHICKNINTRYCTYTRAVFPNKFVISESCMSGHFSELDEHWRKNKDKSLSDEDKKNAQSILNDITTHQKKIYLVAGTPKITLKQALFFFKRLYLNVVVEKLKNPYARVIGFMFTEVARSIKKHIAKLYYHKPKKEKFLFYPLQLSEDCQILMRATHYWNQVSTITFVAKNMPIGYKLYVKEHPNLIGGMPINQLHRINKIPHVKLISPLCSSHDLIKQSSGIIAVNSAVGWEGVLYQKPVINMGKSFYETSGMTYKVRDLYQLRTTIKKALSSSIVDYTQLLKFINSVDQSAYPGNLNFYYQYAKQNLNDKNIQNIADGIIKSLNTDFDKPEME